MYNPIYVANNFIKRSFETGCPITPMKLQKLLYFFYRDYMQKTDRPAFSERFMVWQYGPVLGSIYHEFKRFGGGNIVSYGFDCGKVYIVEETPGTDFTNILNKIWSETYNIDAISLSKLTHDVNGAWNKAFQKNKLFLDDDDIKNDKTKLRVGGL